MFVCVFVCVFRLRVGMVCVGDCLVGSFCVVVDTFVCVRVVACVMDCWLVGWSVLLCLVVCLCVFVCLFVCLFT